MSEPQDRWAWVPLGQMLVNDKVLTTDQLNQALERQRKTRERLGQILIDMKLIDEDMLLKYLGAQFRKESITRQELAAPRPRRRQARAGGGRPPVRRHRGRALGPEAGRGHGRSAERHGPGRSPAGHRARRRLPIGPGRRHPGGHREDVPQARRHGLATRASTRRSRSGPRAQRGPVGGRQAESAVDIRQLQTPGRRSAGRASVVNYVLGRAAARRRLRRPRRAYEDRTRVRYRIDGLLFDLLEVPRAAPPGGGLPASRSSRASTSPSAGCPRTAASPRASTASEIDFRVSTLPTIYGEKVVLRLLEKAAVVEHYSAREPRLRAGAARGVPARASGGPWGMVLITGPTGSGKSTTLHTAIKVIKSPRKNIVTVEDPVEYRQPGIQQVQVKSEIGFDFSRALRSILRQDPDIIMVGEIRDQETAQIAVQGRAHGPPRAVDAAHQRRGLDPRAPHQHRGGALPGGVGGERGRGPAAGASRICKHCKEAYRPTPDELGALRPGPGARSCSTAGAAARSCRNIGYAGRMALYEVFARRRGGAPHGDRRCGRRTRSSATRSTSGMVTLKQCGFRQAARGLTTLEEVLAVAADQE